MSIFSKEWCLDTLERCIGTMAEVAIPLVSVMATEGVIMDVQHTITIIVGSGLVCLLKCIVKATGVKDENTNSN